MFAILLIIYQPLPIFACFDINYFDFPRIGG